MIILSFYIFKSAPPWLKILALAGLVTLLVVPPLFVNRKLPPDLENALKEDDKRR